MPFSTFLPACFSNPASAVRDRRSSLAKTVLSFRCCFVAALYKGAASAVSFTLTVLPLALYVHSKYGPWLLEGSLWLAHRGRPHFIIRFKTALFTKYSSSRSSRRAWRKHWVWARRTAAPGAFGEGIIFHTKMLPPPCASRLHWHGTDRHAFGNSATHKPPRPAAGEA